MRIKKSPNRFIQVDNHGSFNGNGKHSKNQASKIRLVEQLELDEIISENEVEEKPFRIKINGQSPDY